VKACSVLPKTNPIKIVQPATIDRLEVNILALFLLYRGMPALPHQMAMDQNPFVNDSCVALQPTMNRRATP
jgi:hypothetical protein